MTIERDLLLKAVLAAYVLSVVVALGFVASRSEPLQRLLSKTKSGSVAVLHIEGSIQGSMGGSAWNKDDAEDIARRLRKWSEDKEIKVILLRINSPGGTVGGVQEIHRE